MDEYIQNKTEVINSDEKIIFNNQCKNPIEVGTGLIFRKDGTYIVSVYNGKITVCESGDQPEKSIEQLKAEIEKLQFDYKISKIMPPLPPPPIYPAYIGFNKCGEER